MGLLTSRDPDQDRDVWHAGEKQMHRALGIEARMRDRGAVVVRDAMPDQHRAFFADQRFVVLCALDSTGQPNAFLRCGPRGFMVSPRPDQLNISSSALASENGQVDLTVGQKISVLGIEFETRRRNRMNGTITKNDGNQITITVDQSFGNCPRYIHTRDRGRHVEPAPIISEDDRLSPDNATQIRKADMLFLATRAPVIGTDRRAGVDVNHRGGPPGFVTVLETGQIVIPDYSGNNFFNAIGNILLDSRVSLLFPDFCSGHVITLAGHADVVLDAGEQTALFGAVRVLQIIPHHVVRAENALPLRYDLNSLSPHDV